MNFNDEELFPGSMFTELLRERERQIGKGFTLTQIASEGWDELEKTMVAYIRWAGQQQRMGSPDKARKRLMQVATMCLSRAQVLDASGQEPGTTRIPHDFHLCSNCNTTGECANRRVCRLDAMSVQDGTTGTEGQPLPGDRVWLCKCPNCRKEWGAVTPLLGQAVTCPRCHYDHIPRERR